MKSEINVEGCLQTVQSVETPLNTRIQAAAHLVQVAKIIQSTLDSFKGELREMVRSGVTPATMEGIGGSSVVVTTNPPTVKLGDMPVEQAKEVLGEDFDRLFQVSLTFRSQKTGPLETLSEPRRRWISQWITMEDSTARVSFRLPVET